MKLSSVRTKLVLLCWCSIAASVDTVQRCNGTTAGLGYLEVSADCACKSSSWAVVSVHLSIPGENGTIPLLTSSSTTKPSMQIEGKKAFSPFEDQHKPTRNQSFEDHHKPTRNPQAKIRVCLKPNVLVPCYMKHKQSKKCGIGHQIFV